jgi:dTDP-glucose 4,6-dehydratase
MKNVLVTGGAGFIGSNFIHYLLKTEPGVHVINLDALTYAGNPANLMGLPDETRHTFIHGNICDKALVDEIFHRYAIDTVVHFAAETHVDRSILDPAQFVHTNVVGTFTLLEAARQAWVIDKVVPLAETRFQHVSTDEVFGTLAPDDPPFNETTPYAPNSVYSASKASSDHLVRAYDRTYGLPVTITNCSNNYGPYQFPEKLIPLMILNGVTGKSLPIYGDGMQVRDWLYVGDHVEAIYQVLQRGRLGQTYCIGGDNQPPNIEIVHTLCDILDELLPGKLQSSHKDQITYVADRPGHDRRYDINTQKIKAELGWQPKCTLRDGLLATVQWYLGHPEWVSSINQRSDFKSWMDNNYTQRGE